MKITRRQLLQIVGVTGFSGLMYGSYRLGRRHTDLFVDHLYPFVKPTLRWTGAELRAILSHLNEREQLLLLSSLKKESQVFEVDRVVREVRWVASNVVTYPFRDKTNYDYHEEIVDWLADEYQVSDQERQSSSTFLIERRILDAVFVQMWEGMTPEQRRHVLDEVDERGRIQDKAALALSSGATALAALSTTVYFAGFAFYTTMSSIICSTAGVFGVTLPFATYTGASSSAAVLSGPVGWALLALATAGAVLFAGRADHAKTAAFVIQLHLIKVQSLQASDRLESVLHDLHVG